MGKYARKTQHRPYSQEVLDAALNSILIDNRKIREVGRSFQIPESTLRRQLKFKRRLVKRKSNSLGRAPVFTIEEENEIADYMIKLARVFFGLSPIKLRSIAYKFAEENKIRHNFNKERELAGKDWYASFIKRNSNNPECISVSRVTTFNKTEVDRYFKNLEAMIEKYHFSPDRIFNVNETGVSSGIDQDLGVPSSHEQAKNVTVICAMSATGLYIPPLFVFPRLRMSPLLAKNGPKEAIYTCTKNGCSNEEIFLQWLKHFQSKVMSDKNNPLLLVLDNHTSHISIPIYKFCESNDIIMVSLPPHTSHKLQPLDLTFFGPLENAYSQHCDLYLKTKGNSSDQESKMTLYDIAEVFNMAYSEVANIEQAVSGFKAAGIYPFNSDKFAPHDFETPHNSSAKCNEELVNKKMNVSL